MGEPGPLHHLSLRLLELGGHLVDRVRQEAELGPVLERDARAQLAAPDPLHAGAQDPDRTKEDGHEQEGGRDPRDQERAEDQVLLPAHAIHGLVDVGSADPHERLSEESPVQVANGCQYEEHGRVLGQNLVGSARDGRAHGLQARGHLEPRSDLPHLGISLDDAGSIDHQDERQLGLLRPHLLHHRGEQELRVLGEERVRAGDREIPRLDEEAGLDLVHEDAPRLPLHDPGDAEHDERRENGRGARDDPADAEHGPLAGRHRLPSRISRARVCCVRARVM